MARVESLTTTRILELFAEQAALDAAAYAASWEPVSLVETADRVAAAAAQAELDTVTYAPISSMFMPATAYKAGQLVINAGRVYSAKIDFTSTASFSITNWNLVSPFNAIIIAYNAGIMTDVTTVVTIATATFTAVTGCIYRITAGLVGSQITTTGTPTVKLLMDTVEQFRMATGVSIVASGTVYGPAVNYFFVGDGASHTFTVSAQTGPGGLRIPVSGINQLVIEQIA